LERRRGNSNGGIGLIDAYYYASIASPTLYVIDRFHAVASERWRAFPMSREARQAGGGKEGAVRSSR
jgi:hypothetical protein